MTGAAQEVLLASAELKRQMAADSRFCSAIEEAARRLLETARNGGVIYACGNGGSACDAMHLCEELLARYKRVRPGIRSRHLLDAGVMSCWANDEDFSGVFARQVETLCGPHDALVAFSTSGDSENVARAVEAARSCGTFSLGLLGKDGGRLKDLCDLSLIVPSQETERIQEAHITIVHVFCEILECELFPGDAN